MQSAKDSRTEINSRAQLLDGAVIAEQIKQEVAQEIDRLWAEHEVKPCLAAVRVGDDAASAVYVRNKMRACEEVGIRSEHHALPATTTAVELADLIESLNTRADVDGILVQLPLPGDIEEAGIIEAIDPAKDVDGFHPINIGRLSMGRPTFAPCTPAGIIELLERSRIAISGTNACVVGRSQIVGRPMAQLLLQRDATVTICHSRTRDLESVTRLADLLIVAIGRPGFVGGEHIKPGATVIDVGIRKPGQTREAQDFCVGLDVADWRLRGETPVSLAPVPAPCGALPLGCMAHLRQPALDPGERLRRVPTLRPRRRQDPSPPAGSGSGSTTRAN